jgi:ribosomal protein S18 acetylase RimI-like enzyme
VKKSSSPRHAKQPDQRLLIKELGRETWPDFEKFFEDRRLTWSGCWCVPFHLKPGEAEGTAAERRALKDRLVREDRSHSALVYDGPELVGWCQFGSPAELPGRMTGFFRLGVASPDWRITCFVVDRERRRQGIAKAALEGALRLIAAKGGGTVDGYPIDTLGKPYSSSFLWGGTKSMFSELGFRKLGALGSSKWVMRKTVRGRVVSV